MVSIRSIILNNNATFYNYRTGERIRVWPRIALLVVFSPILGFLLNDNLTDFINSINTVSSILLGFSFSVLFYIAEGRQDPIPEDYSLEKRNRIENIRELSKELFHNISYFVMVSSAALATSMVVIAPEAQNDWFNKIILPKLADITPEAAEFMWWLQISIRSVFFFLVLEGGYSFGRIVGRVNFLFEEKLKG
ncbi:hypothetical protein SAMN05880582_101193 [Rhizobium sp. RU20A]|uniref:hypothetical protein n=1 Tax=Rhizobium sp. RU20A TaxID=1907412 RepID=UPI00095522DE|nr:hypothetical protein [Rhizobium sp. RU20A]SIP96536.1 hypothetical protein SAMN05880582_101193 [Rhizobium sp. RU20A]